MPPCQRAVRSANNPNWFLMRGMHLIHDNSKVALLKIASLPQGRGETPMEISLDTQSPMLKEVFFGV